MTHTHTILDSGAAVEARGNVRPGYRATMLDPGHGPYVEDMAVRINGGEWLDPEDTDIPAHELERLEDALVDGALT